jgi:tRNA pseudouridine13 synthase
MESKEDRTVLHQTVRKLFKGRLESQLGTGGTESEGKIIIRWPRSGARSRGRYFPCLLRSPRHIIYWLDSAQRGNFPPYIHFTLQKTNRDTQDAIGHLSRLLKVNVKDLSTAGTKDKRGVTVQRVSLKRNNKTVEDIWRLANSRNGHTNFEHALKERGEKGIRIADFNYRRASLELGMLKGNAFVITLRYATFNMPGTVLTFSGM